MFGKADDSRLETKGFGRKDSFVAIPRSNSHEGTAGVGTTAGRGRAGKLQSSCHCNGREQNVATKLRRDYCTGCAKGSSFLGPPQTKRSTIVRLAIQAGDDWFVYPSCGACRQADLWAGLLGRYLWPARRVIATTNWQHHSSGGFIVQVDRGSVRPLRASRHVALPMQYSRLSVRIRRLSAVGRGGGVGAAVVVGEFVVGERPNFGWAATTNVPSRCETM